MANDGGGSPLSFNDAAAEMEIDKVGAVTDSPEQPTMTAPAARPANAPLLHIE